MLEWMGEDPIILSGADDTPSAWFVDFDFGSVGIVEKNFSRHNFVLAVCGGS